MTKRVGKNELKADRYVWGILTPILKPFIKVYNILYPDFKYERNFLSKKDKCYCGSGKDYIKCCKKTDKQKRQKPIKVCKINKRTGNVVEKIELLKLNSFGNSRIQKGGINPLNKNGNFMETNIGEGYLDNDSSD